MDRGHARIRKGEVIALIGENGSGKTTLSKLLTGLFLPTAGTVSWDAHKLADCDIDTVLRQVAVVSQDYTRWPLAARENLTLGQPRPEGDSAVHAAAEAAGADSVIAGLPHGLDTSLARSWWGGHDVSGGQWQRLAVARAFHRDAHVLILDEPTAALDARAEHHILTRLRALASGRTTVYITHRLVNTNSQGVSACPGDGVLRLMQLSAGMLELIHRNRCGAIAESGEFTIAQGIKWCSSAASRPSGPVLTRHSPQEEPYHPSEPQQR
ncbi:ATP-binding cassette domain-containing protein [Streptomyces sp. NPDC050585]|uniref:ATP-binding cassette domain-containing protein n=1 Tax=Streptomyces sp. NPDC050585 TaxID=3365632 RepID=UPI0037A51918